MIEKKIQIRNLKGIHVRPSSIIVKALQKVTDKVVISGNGRTVRDISVLALLGMCLQCGDYIQLLVDGPDEQRTSMELAALFSKKYDFS